MTSELLRRLILYPEPNSLYNLIICKVDRRGLHSRRSFTVRRVSDGKRDGLIQCTHVFFVVFFLGGGVVEKNKYKSLKVKQLYFLSFL